MNISGGVAVWIHNFLSDRKQRVAVDGTPEEESHVINGVPQGSVLGLILFLICISDINKNTHHSSISSFADDTRVLKQISSIEDCRSIANNICFNTM